MIDVIKSIVKMTESNVIANETDQQRLVHQMVAELKSARDRIEVLSKAFQESKEDNEMLKRELRQQQQSTPTQQQQSGYRQEEERGKFQCQNKAGDVSEIRPSTAMPLLVGQAPQYPLGQTSTGGLNNQEGFQSQSTAGLSYPQFKQQQAALSEKDQIVNNPIDQQEMGATYPQQGAPLKGEPSMYTPLLLSAQLASSEVVESSMLMTATVPMIHYEWMAVPIKILYPIAEEGSAASADQHLFGDASTKLNPWAYQVIFSIAGPTGLLLFSPASDSFTSDAGWDNQELQFQFQSERKLVAVESLRAYPYPESQEFKSSYHCYHPQRLPVPVARFICDSIQTKLVAWFVWDNPISPEKEICFFTNQPSVLSPRRAVVEVGSAASAEMHTVLCARTKESDTSHLFHV